MVSRKALTRPVTPSRAGAKESDRKRVNMKKALVAAPKVNKGKAKSPPSSAKVKPNPRGRRKAAYTDASLPRDESSKIAKLKRTSSKPASDKLVTRKAAKSAAATKGQGATSSTPKAAKRNSKGISPSVEENSISKRDHVSQVDGAQKPGKQNVTKPSVRRRNAAEDREKSSSNSAKDAIAKRRVSKPAGGDELAASVSEKLRTKRVLSNEKSEKKQKPTPVAPKQKAVRDVSRNGGGQTSEIKESGGSSISSTGLSSASKSSVPKLLNKSKSTKVESEAENTNSLKASLKRGSEKPERTEELTKPLKRGRKPKLETARNPKRKRSPSANSSSSIEELDKVDAPQTKKRAPAVKETAEKKASKDKKLPSKAAKGNVSFEASTRVSRI